MMSHSLIQKIVWFISIDHNDSLSLTCILYISILTFTHFSHFTHIYNNYIFSLYQLAWEFKKLFVISFITLCFIRPKINELLIKLNIKNCLIIMWTFHFGSIILNILVL